MRMTLTKFDSITPKWFFFNREPHVQKRTHRLPSRFLGLSPTEPNQGILPEGVPDLVTWKRVLHFCNQKSCFISEEENPKTLFEASREGNPDNMKSVIRPQ
jgi:hypothetical protein